MSFCKIGVLCVQLIRRHAATGVFLSTSFVSNINNSPAAADSFSVIKNNSLEHQMKTTSISALAEVWLASKLLDLYQTSLESLINEYTTVVHSLCSIYESEKILQEEHDGSIMLTKAMSDLKREILDMQQLQEYVVQSLENSTKASFLLGNAIVSEQSWDKIASFNKEMEQLWDSFNNLSMELARAKVTHIEMVSKEGNLDKNNE